MEESKQRRHFTVIADLNVAPKIIMLIPVHVRFITVKNCGFIMGFVILAIYFRLKTNIFNVKT